MNVPMNSAASTRIRMVVSQVVSSSPRPQAAPQLNRATPPQIEGILLMPVLNLLNGLDGTARDYPQFYATSPHRMNAMDRRFALCHYGAADSACGHGYEALHGSCSSSGRFDDAQAGRYGA
jgi:hypothetical protein